MISFKKYIQKLGEDKLITKEDDGGAPVGGGEVSAPPSAPAPDLGIHAPEHGLTQGDILGKNCHHDKDGVFGPGCFHLPYPVFGFFTRKSKKKRKYDNIYENDEDYSRFCDYCQPLALEKVHQATDYLQHLNNKFHLDTLDDYHFDDSNTQLATIVRDQEDPNHFPVAFDMRDFYKNMYENGFENDEQEIEAQITYALWKAIGQALLQYLICSGETEQVQSDCENQMCDEFGKYHLQDITGCNKSKIQDIINKIYKND